MLIDVFHYRETLNSHVRDCVRCYTSPWLVVQHRYQEFSSGSLARQSVTRLNALASTPRQEFEIDGENDVNANHETESTVIDPISTKVFLKTLCLKYYFCFHIF